MPRQLVRLVISLLFLLSSSLAAQAPDGRQSATSAPQIQVPRVIRISGTLSDLSGSTSPSLEIITFTLYQDQAGTTPLWSETQNVQIGARGGYQVLLGADTPDGIPLSLFSAAEAKWLGVRVDGQAEQPLVMFVSVPYALKAADAEALGGKPPSSYLTVDQLGSATPSEAAKPTPASTEKAIGPITGEGMNRYLARFNGPNSLTYSRIYETSTGDGIFTSTPRSEFDVRGEITADRFTLRDPVTSNLWSWAADVDPADQQSRFRLLYRPLDPIPGYPNGYPLLNVKGDRISLNHDKGRAQLDVDGNIALTYRLSFAQDTGTTTPTFGMDNVKNPNNNNRSTFQFYYQPGFNEWGTVLMGAVSGAVGFFTNTPRRGLDVWGEVTATNRLTLAQDTGTTSPTWHLDNTNSLFRLYHQPNINTSGTTILTATRSGQVGIGVYNPTHTLDVAGSVAINGSGNGLVFPDGSTQTTATLQGPPGSQGPSGPQGPAGLQGPPGPAVSTIAVCVQKSWPWNADCSCAVRLVAKEVAPDVSGGSHCSVTSNTGSCSANGNWDSLSHYSGACCVCAPS